MSAGEVFLLCQRVRASAPMGVAPEPPGGSGRTIRGVLFQRACVHVFSLRWNFVNHGVVAQPRRFLGAEMRQNLLIPASVRAADQVRRLVRDKP